MGWDFREGGGHCFFSWGATGPVQARSWGVRGCWQRCREAAGNAGAAGAAAWPWGAAVPAGCSSLSLGLAESMPGNKALAGWGISLMSAHIKNGRGVAAAAADEGVACDRMWVSETGTTLQESFISFLYLPISCLLLHSFYKAKKGFLQLILTTISLRTR